MLSVVVAYVLVTSRHLAMAASAVAVSVALNGHADVDEDGKIPAAVRVQCVIVITSAIAVVASLGRQASLGRDWVPNTVDVGEMCTGIWFIFIISSYGPTQISCLHSTPEYTVANWGK